MNAHGGSAVLVEQHGVGGRCLPPKSPPPRHRLGHHNWTFALPELALRLEFQMNQDFARLHTNASLALAAYSDFTSILSRPRQANGAVSDADLKQVLISGSSSGRADFTSLTAAAFALEYELLDQYTHHTSGYSATLFRRKGDGRVIWVQRGTGGSGSGLTPWFDLGADLIADGALGGGWIPLRQTVEMVNYYLRLSAPANADVRQVFLNSDNQPALISVGAKGLGYTAAMQSFDVAGHSLGGYLTAIVGFVFGNRVNSAYAFNNPGIHGFSLPGSDSFWRILGQAIGRVNRNTLSEIAALVNQPPTGFLGPDRFTEIVADWHVTKVPGRTGNVVDLVIENRSHSQIRVVDALALGTMMEDLVGHGPLNLDLFNWLVQRGSSRKDSKYEYLLDRLRAIIQGPSLPPTKPYAAEDSQKSRIDFYENIADMQQSDPYHLLKGKVHLRQVTTNLAIQARARVDFQTLVALETLSPFLLDGVGASGEAALLQHWAQSGWASTYTKWLEDKASLARGGEAIHYSDRWLADRSALLAAMLVSSSADTTTVSGGIAGEVIVTPALFQELSSETRILWGQADRLDQRKHVIFGGEDPDDLQGYARDDALFGGAGNDRLSGQGGDDHLEAGMGMDELEGGQGNDYLSGGSGFDRYRFEASFGSDVLVDSDGIGEILIGGRRVEGGMRVGVGVNSWRSADGFLLFTLVNQAAGMADLMITRRVATDSVTLDGTIKVRNWSNGQLGIALDLNAAPSPTPTRQVTGGFIKARNDNGSRYVIIDSNYVNAGADPNAQDLLVGDISSDLLSGGAGNDALLGGDGDDLIDGDDGADTLLGGFGRDRLYGGAGDDYIDGSGTFLGFQLPRTPEEANPKVAGQEWARGFGWVVYDPPGVDGNGQNSYINTIHNWQIRDDLGDTIDAGAGNDRISAGTGNDVAMGGDGNDDIKGLDGADILYGDGGDDDIEGDGILSPDYILVYTPLENHGDDWLHGGDGNDSLTGQGGDDRLFGGLGNDRLFGDGRGGVSSFRYLPGENHGDDYLDGGAGSDELLGGGGADELVGGADADLIYGDDQPEDLDGRHHGNDKIHAGDGDDTVVGGGGDDAIEGDAGNDMIIGDDVVHSTAATPGADVIRGGDGNDILFGDYSNEEPADSRFGGSDILYGESGLDILMAAAGNDYLDGGPDSDTLYGGLGNDILIGGMGSDYLDGGDGDDVYFFDADDSAALSTGELDTVVDALGANLIILKGASTATLEVASNPLGMAVGWGGNSGIIIQSPGAAGDGSSSFRFELADGSTLSTQALVGNFSDQSIRLQDSAGHLVVLGGRNVDAIATTAPNQTIAGGKANDSLTLFQGGGSTVLFGSGDGLDSLSLNSLVTTTALPNVLVLGPGLVPDDLRLRVMVEPSIIPGIPGRQRAYIGTARGEGFRLGNLSAEELLQVQGAFSAFRFDDGRSTSWDQLKSTRFLIDLQGSTSDGTVRGTAYDDEVAGDWGSRSFYLLDGDDLAQAGSGNESFVLGRGSDRLVVPSGFGKDRVLMKEDVSDESGLDVVTFASDLDLSAARFYRTGDDLVVRFTGADDQLTVISFFRPSIGISLEFAPGNVHTADTLMLSPVAELASEEPDHWALTPGADFFDGLAGADTINGLDGNDTLFGGPGDDSLQGDNGDDVLSGGSGDDFLSGGGGNDQLEGGYGNDDLNGNAGNNTYIFGLGDGMDSITSYDPTVSKSNTLRFKLGIAPADVSLQRDGNYSSDVVLRFAGSSDSLVIRGFANPDHPASLQGRAHNPVQRIAFADGSLWSLQTMVQKLLSGGSGNDMIQGFSQSELIQGGAGDDVLEGRGGNDTLRGGDGDDILFAEEGNDLLHGGKGDDILWGWSGLNTYLFERGDGSDLIGYQSGAGAVGTIQFGAGISPSEVFVRLLDSVALELSIEHSRDRIVVNNFASPYLDGPVQTIRFADGTTWIYSEILARQSLGTDSDDVVKGGDASDVLLGRAGDDEIWGEAGNDNLHGGEGDDQLRGQAGDDSLFGGVGNDILHGGSGNDMLIGGEGNDTYIFGRGSGQDVIDTSDPGIGKVDVLQLGPRLRPASIALARQGDDLLLSILGPGGHSLRVLGHFHPNILRGSRIDQIQFGDGTLWGEDFIASMVN